MTQKEREQFWIRTEDELLLGGACFSEWCTFISKSVYIAFTNGTDLATIITSMACIETYFKTEDPSIKSENLASLIDSNALLTETEKHQLHILRKYRNSWVHVDRIDDAPILTDELPFLKEAEEMACLSVRMLMVVLFSSPFV